MDQAKWSIPRNKTALVPKALSGFQRPRFKVQGTWCHDVLLKLWLVHPRVPSDSSMVIETASRTIQQVLDICHSRNASKPDQLTFWVAWNQLCWNVYQLIVSTLTCKVPFGCRSWSLQADNCVRETKNQWMLNVGIDGIEQDIIPNSIIIV